MVLSLLFDERSIKEISIIHDINPRLKFLHVIEPPPKKLCLENIANFQGINTCFQNYSLRVNSKWQIYLIWHICYFEISFKFWFWSVLQVFNAPPLHTQEKNEKELEN